MNITRWLGFLWVAMIISMILKWQADTYMVVALIVLPILIVLLDLHEEIATLKEENRHQRKFVMDRYNLLQERMKELTTHLEKRMVVDFAELAKESLKKENESRLKSKIKKHKKDYDEKLMNLAEETDSEDEDDNTYLDEEKEVEEYEDI